MRVRPSLHVRLSTPCVLRLHRAGPIPDDVCIPGRVRQFPPDARRDDIEFAVGAQLNLTERQESTLRELRRQIGPLRNWSDPDNEINRHLDERLDPPTEDTRHPVVSALQDYVQQAVQAALDMRGLELRKTLWRVAGGDGTSVLLTLWIELSEPLVEDEP